MRAPACSAPLDEGDLVQVPLSVCGTLTTGPVTEQHWGLELTTGALRMVSTAKVYPVLGGTPMPYRAPVGAAGGRSWADAIAAGLRAHCEALLIQRSDPGGRNAWRGDATEVIGEVADEPAMRLLRVLHAADQRIRVTDLSSVLGGFRWGTNRAPSRVSWSRGPSTSWWRLRTRSALIASTAQPRAVLDG